MLLLLLLLFVANIVLGTLRISGLLFAPKSSIRVTQFQKFEVACHDMVGQRCHISKRPCWEKPAMLNSESDIAVESNQARQRSLLAFVVVPSKAVRVHARIHSSLGLRTSSEIFIRFSSDVHHISSSQLPSSHRILASYNFMYSQSCRKRQITLFLWRL